MTARPRTASLLALLLTALALAGCTSSGDSSSSSAAGVAAGPARSEASSGGAAPAVAAAPDTAATDFSLARDVVRTAGLTVQVPDVRAAADRARGIAETAGGGLEAEDASAGTDTLRLRVAPDRLGSSLDALARLGTETARTVGSEDVTGTVADLDSRLATQRASVERVRALLSGAKALSDIVTLEGQLTQREGDLESLQARQKALQGKADLATVTLTLTVPPAAPAKATRATFTSGLTAGLDALLGSARAVAVVAGALLPFLPLLLLAGWLVRRYARRAPSAAT